MKSLWFAIGFATAIILLMGLISDFAKAGSPAPVVIQQRTFWDSVNDDLYGNDSRRRAEEFNRNQREQRRDNQLETLQDEIERLNRLIERQQRMERR